MRVLLASEWPKVQHLLTDMVEEEPGAIVVGQAENAVKTLVLAENLRPDIAIIDSNLPYSVGMDTLTLSRMSGLDAAQIICQKIPSTRVVIVNNLDTEAILEGGLSGDNRPFFSREINGGNTAFKLQELNQKTVMLWEAPVFANVETLTRTSHKDEKNQEKVVTGTVSIAGGLYLIGTLWLAPYGALLVLWGVASLGFGLLRKATARLRQKRVNRDER